MFSNLLKDSTKKKQPLDVKKQVVDAPAGRPVHRPHQPLKKSRSPSRPSSRPPEQSTGGINGPNGAARQRLIRRARSSSSAVDFGTEGSDSEDDNRVPKTKKARVIANGSSTGRRIWSGPGDELDLTGAGQLVHAAEICALDKTTKYESLFNAPMDTEVQVQYPSQASRER